MRKKWKRIKNKILSFFLALMFGVASVLPGMEVKASEVPPSEEEQLEILGAWEDKNNDKKINIDEVNPFKLLACTFTSLGFWCDTSTQLFSDTVDLFRSWFITDSDLLLGWLGDDGLIYLSDDVWEFVRSLANSFRGNDGYTIYPALESSKNYWYSLSGANLSTSEYNKFIRDGLDFGKGTPIAKSGSTYYITSCIESYYLRVHDGSAFFIMNGDDIDTYRFKSGEFVSQSVSSASYVKRYKLSSSTTAWKTTDWSTDISLISPKSPFLGLTGVQCLVFDNAAAAVAYMGFDRSIFESSHGGNGGSFSPSVFNSKDWESLNSSVYSTLKDRLQSSGSLSNAKVQELIDDYTEDVLSNLGLIEQGQESQTNILSKIYDLLVEWFPKLGKGGGDTNIDVDIDVDPDLGNDFENNSNVQKEELDGLIQDSQVEKPDIDNTNQLVDENLDMGNVEEYGTLLSVFTGNQRILSFILISLTAGLIAYVFYGKR